MGNNKKKQLENITMIVMSLTKKRPDMFEVIDPKITEQELSLLLGEPLSPEI